MEASAPGNSKKKDEERKAGGVPWASSAGEGASLLPEGGAETASAVSGAAENGAGLASWSGGGMAGGGDLLRQLAERAGAFLIANPFVLILAAAGVAAATAGAWSAGLLNMPAAAPGPQRIFEQPPQVSAPDRADIPTGDRDSSLRFVAEPNAGALGPQSGGGAAANGQAGKDGSDASKDATADKTPDPGALAAQAVAQATSQNANAGGIGRLSTNLGQGLGGMAGGAGLSGGIGQPFAKLNAPNSALGQLQAFARAPAPDAGPKRSVLPSGTMRGSAMSRLRAMNGIIKPTAAMNNLEKANGTTTGAWDGTAGNTSIQPGAGSPITGGGDSTGGGGDSSAGSDGQPLGHVSPSLAPAQKAPSPPSKNVTPWQGLVDTATYMLMAASGLLALAGMIGMMKNPVAITIAMALSFVAAGLGAAVAAIGGMIMSQGQSLQGGIFLAMGGITAALAALAGLSYRSAKAIRSVQDQAAKFNSLKIRGALMAGGGSAAAGIGAEAPGLASTMDPGSSDNTASSGK